MNISSFKNSISNLDNSFIFYKEINWNKTSSEINQKSPLADRYVSNGILLVLKDNEIEGLKAGTYLKLEITNENPVYIDMQSLVIGANTITNEQIAKGTISRDKIDALFERSLSALEKKLVGSNDSVAEQINAAIIQCNTYTDNSTMWIQL